MGRSLQKNKKVCFFGFFWVVWCLIILSCPAGGTTTEKEREFISPPVVTLAADSGGYTYTWTDSDPPADNYDIYWRKARHPSGKWSILTYGEEPVTKAQNGGALTVTLQNGEYLSVFVAANKKKYTTIDSAVATEGIPASPPQISGNDDDDEDDKVEKTESFFAGAVLTVTPEAGGLHCSWTHSDPVAHRYDLYFIEGNYTSVDKVKMGGARVRNAVSPYILKDLDSGTPYTVVITATRSGYIDIHSVRANIIPLDVPPASESVKQGIQP